MSDERLRELGIQRRRFLKGTAAAAFASPIVVSFALDGSADARGRFGIPNGQQCPNQAEPNQFYSNQYLEPERALVEIIYRSVYGLDTGQLTRGFANSLSHRALGLAVMAASGGANLCPGLASLVAQINQLPFSELKNELLSYAEEAQSVAGCPHC